MIDKRTKLFIFHDDNGSFADYSNQAADYTRDTFDLTLVSAEDYLYIGFEKAINSIYVELSTPNTNPNEFTLEYWDGSAWDTLALTDETLGWTRSGFMYWDKGDLASTTVNATEAVFVRLRPDSDHSLTTIQGINLVFADDNAMQQEFYEINNSNILPNGQSSHILTHVASRNHIVQKLRHLGYIKVNSSNNSENIDQWDLHDIFEMRQAAMFLALSKIFFNLSDSVDDNWWQKYQTYQNKFEEMFSVAKLSLDTDDDGVNDNEEKNRKTFVVRWNR